MAKETKTNKQTEIKKLEILSVGKIAAALYFIFGILIVILMVVLKKIAANIQIPLANMAGLEQLTTGMLILIPFYQAIIGFIAGIVIAALYNLLAKKIGGIKIEI